MLLELTYFQLVARVRRYDPFHTHEKWKIMHEIRRTKEVIMCAIIELKRMADGPYSTLN